jgi:CheY-like chemotaxis protein
MEKAEILVVENEERILESLANEFRIKGVRVITARNDEEGLRAFYRYASSISTVITDMRLRSSRRDDHSGGEFAKRLKDIAPNLPVYCFSAIDVRQKFPYFERYFIKGAFGKNDIFSNIPSIIEKAVGYENARFASVPESLVRLKKKYEPDSPGLAPTVPDQSPAPVRVEVRDGRIARITDRDSPLGTAELDFNGWREPVFDHIQEMLSGDFRLGTNHSRARDRLVALATLLSGTVAEIKDRQFRIGYEIERFGGLVSAYRSGADDMPMLSAPVLEDMDRLGIALVMGISKLERWAEFRRQAAADPLHDGDANPVTLSEGLEDMAAQMDRRTAYFDPELPGIFRFLIESAKDPRGATRTVVYGAVTSAENVVSFLGRKALGIGANTVGAVEQHITKAVAAALVVALSSAALTISGALPVGWSWLKPLLEALARGGGG